MRAAEASRKLIRFLSFPRDQRDRVTLFLRRSIFIDSRNRRILPPGNIPPRGNRERGEGVARYYVIMIFHIPSTSRTRKMLAHSWDIIHVHRISHHVGRTYHRGNFEVVCLLKGTDVPSMVICRQPLFTLADEGAHCTCALHVLFAGSLHVISARIETRNI